MWQSLENLNIFHTLTLKQDFLVESLKIENGTFPYKTYLSDKENGEYKMSLPQRKVNAECEDYFSKIDYYSKKL